MPTPVALHDDLIAEARELTGLQDKSALLRERLALIQRESARRLARLGGIAPDLDMPRRRRSPQ